MPRGAFQFETSDAGDLSNTATNVEILRRLWLHHTLVSGNDIGPGDRGDFDKGAWHVSCHLAGAGGARRTRAGQIAWLEISHDRSRDEYFASVTVRGKKGSDALPLDSADGRALLADSKLLGFVEGNSTGRISARAVNDPPDLFNLWRRQDFDQPVSSREDGGKVWEHWCTLRDIRPGARLGTSVLSAYVSLVSALGDRFAATVCRGRRDYGHPVQLAALVYAGFVDKRSALWEGSPTPLTPEAERLLLEAEPARALQAAESLDWSKPPRYYMFRRRIRHWNPLAAARKTLEKFEPS
jgi:hypothetical protein